MASKKSNDVVLEVPVTNVDGSTQMVALQVAREDAKKDKFYTKGHAARVGKVATLLVKTITDDPSAEIEPTSDNFLALEAIRGSGFIDKGIIDDILQELDALLDAEEEGEEEEDVAEDEEAGEDTESAASSASSKASAAASTASTASNKAVRAVVILISRAIMNPTADGKTASDVLTGVVTETSSPTSKKQIVSLLKGVKKWADDMSKGAVYIDDYVSNADVCDACENGLRAMKSHYRATKRKPSDMCSDIAARTGSVIAAFGGKH